MSQQPTIAFFDLDYTLLDTSSSLLYIREAVRQGRVYPWTVLSIGLRQRLGRIDFGQAHTELIARVARQGQAEAELFFREWVPRRVFPRLTARGRAKIEWHRHQGHRPVIISATISEIVGQVADHLGFDPGDGLGSRLAIQNDHYTGQLDGPLCYGPGKVYWAKRWAARNNLDLAQTTTYFYSDSASDLPLLELASHPVAVNPSRKLARLAQARGWPVERFY